ncbi:MAG TPA: hypothetical protein VGR54_02045 [Nitrosopumilaceae archaeon]|nr:hypothetical protein [Nitrosopumilaceae archaeon]
MQNERQRESNQKAVEEQPQSPQNTQPQNTQVSTTQEDPNGLSKADIELRAKTNPLIKGFD